MKFYSTQFHSFLLIIATCKDGNKSYPVGITYRKNDCSSECTCLNGGIPVYRSLCLPNTTVCRIGEIRQNYEEEVAGTNCSCTKQICLSSMLYYCFYNQLENLFGLTLIYI